MEALYVGSSSKRLCHLLPVLSALHLNCFSEHDIFLLGPVSLAGSILVFSRSNFIPLVSHTMLNNCLKKAQKRYKMNLFLSITYLVGVTLVIVLLKGCFGLGLYDLMHVNIGLPLHKDGSRNRLVALGSWFLPSLVNNNAGFTVSECLRMRTFVSICHVILLIRVLNSVKVLFEGLDNFLVELFSEGPFVKKMSLTF